MKAKHATSQLNVIFDVQDKTAMHKPEPFSGNRCYFLRGTIPGLFNCL